MDKNKLLENVMEAHDLISDALTNTCYPDDEVILDELQTKAMNILITTINDALMATNNAIEYLAID